MVTIPDINYFFLTPTGFTKVAHPRMKKPFWQLAISRPVILGFFVLSYVMLSAGCRHPWDGVSFFCTHQLFLRNNFPLGRDSQLPTCSREFLLGQKSFDSIQSKNLYTLAKHYREGGKNQKRVVFWDKSMFCQIPIWLKARSKLKPFRLFLANNWWEDFSFCMWG